MELRIEIGRFGEGIDPREHLCLECLKNTICGLRSGLQMRAILGSTAFDTLIVKKCSLFSPREEE